MCLARSSWPLVRFGQQPLGLLKHTKQFPQIRVQRLPALPLYTDLRGPIRVGRKAYPREPLTQVVSGGGQAAYDQVRLKASYLPLQHPTLCAYYWSAGTEDVVVGRVFLSSPSPLTF